MSFLKKMRTVVFFILCLGIALASWRFMIGGVEATMEFVAYHAIERQLAFFLHVGLAPVALALMPFQFWGGLRSRRPALHRWIGRTYALAILLAGLGGLAMALGTHAGPIAAAGFAALAVLWLGTTGYAIWLARQRNIAAHKSWMLRSGALTFAAVTLRLYLPFLFMGFGVETGYTIVAWLCWVPNALVAEWILRKPKQPQMQALAG